MLRLSEAYSDLDTCRTLGMMAGKIPWTALDTWAQRQRDLDDEARAICVRALRYVDDVEFAERATKKTPTPPRQPPRGPVARTAVASGGER